MAKDKSTTRQAHDQVSEQSGEQPPSAHLQARILAEALPNMLRYDEQTVVIKFGGHAMGDEQLADAFAKDVVYLKQSGINPIVVHGGGPQIANLLKKLEIKIGVQARPEGHRQADRRGRRDGPRRSHQQGHRVGHQPSGRQGRRHLRQGCQPDDRQEDHRDAGPRDHLMQAVDIGFVGDPAEVNPHIVDVISQSDLIPVIAPVAVSREGETLNVNADTFASALAARMKAKRLLLLTDVEGVLDKQGKLIEELTIEEARALIRNGTISGGMIPKIEGCIEVVEAGVEAVVIINGKVPHSVLLELLTDHGAGTLVGSRKAKPKRK